MTTEELVQPGGKVLCVEDLLNGDGHARVWPDGSIMRRGFEKDGPTDWEATVELNPFVTKKYGEAALIRLVDYFRASRCHDCGVMPGDLHEPGCSVDPCPLCGRSADGSCKCIRDEAWFEEVQQLGGTLRWDGSWPGQREAIEYGLWCKWTITQTSHAFVSCKIQDQGSKPDLGTLIQVCNWDKTKRRWVKRQTEEITTSGSP